MLDKTPNDYIELISRLRPFKVNYTNNYTENVFVYDKPPIEHLETVGYLWDDNKKGDLDEKDTKFISSLERTNHDDVFIAEGWNMKKYIGTHSCVGYYGFFRPNLIDVIKLIGNDIRNIKRPIYVTTEPCCQSGKLTDQSYECYDSVNNRHFGRTVIYWEKQNKKRKRTKKKRTKKKRTKNRVN